MYKLIVHPDAEEDLKAVRLVDPATAADLIVFLEEVRGDQDLLDRLTQKGYSFENGDWIENIDVQPIASQQQAGRNLWRLKLWDLEREGIKYRILYAFAPRTRSYHILAIVERSKFNYEPSHPITLRVLRAHEDI